VRLNPTEEDRLRVFALAQLSRMTLDRGLPLNVPEAVAIVCDELHMAARAGLPYAEVMNAGRAAIAPDQVLDGVADLVPEIRVEVLLAEGTRLLVLREPFGPPTPDGPGAVRFADGEVDLVPGRERRRLSATNSGRRPVRVSSHYPFWQVNPSMVFDRDAARGFRLDLQAGDSLRWAPGQTREIDLVAYGGAGPPDVRPDGTPDEPES
jgi:urease subunit gamma/beta